MLAGTCFCCPRGRRWMESPDPCWLRAKPRGAPTAIAAFMYLYPGVHPGVALLISGPNTHTPIIIIIIIVIYFVYIFSIHCDIIRAIFL